MKTLFEKTSSTLVHSTSSSLRASLAECNRLLNEQELQIEASQNYVTELEEAVQLLSEQNEQQQITLRHCEERLLESENYRLNIEAQMQTQLDSLTSKYTQVISQQEVDINRLLEDLKKADDRNKAMEEENNSQRSKILDLTSLIEELTSIALDNNSAIIESASTSDQIAAVDADTVPLEVTKDTSEGTIKILLAVSENRTGGSDSEEEPSPSRFTISRDLSRLNSSNYRRLQMGNGQNSYSNSTGSFMPPPPPPNRPPPFNLIPLCEASSGDSSVVKESNTKSITAWKDAKKHEAPLFHELPAEDGRTSKDYFRWQEEVVEKPLSSKEDSNNDKTNKKYSLVRRNS